MKKHSPLPFIAYGCFIDSKKSGYIARTAKTTETDEKTQIANAIFIAEACNHYHYSIWRDLTFFFLGGIIACLVLISI
jgi:hypothetical protein